MQNPFDGEDAGFGSATRCPSTMGEAVGDARRRVGRMAPELTGDLHGVLQALLGLYGEGQPQAGQNATYQVTAADTSALSGKGMTSYADARGMHTSLAETHSGKESVAIKAVAESGDGTVNGRNRLNHQIADLQARMQAIAAVGDTRFSGPALLDAAQNTLTNATKRVNADVAAAHQQAARIMPPRHRSPGPVAAERHRAVAVAVVRDQHPDCSAAPSRHQTARGVVARSVLPKPGSALPTSGAVAVRAAPVAAASIVRV